MTFSKHWKIKTVIQEYSTQPGYKSDMKKKLKAFWGKQQLREFTPLDLAYKKGWKDPFDQKQKGKVAKSLSKVINRMRKL